ncbi:MAG: Mrp/NBP35 family ATP-binding protein [Clostridiales bacterium]|nr:Mrp/NBP35 family ATP-binding protein [Clostridiales bacterium]
MSENCNRQCDSCNVDCPSREESIPKEALNEYSQVKKVIGVVSGKGGVGKSLITSLLAVKSAKAGYKTAILDGDITGPSIPKAFGIHEKAKGNEMGIFPARTATGIEIISVNMLLPEETDPVVWRGPVIAGTVKQFWSDVIWGDIDLMFIDMPPGTGDVPLTVFQSIPVDGIVIVTTPQELVGMIVTKAIKMAEMMHIPVLGLVENMSYVLCPDCGKKINIFGESRLEEKQKEFEISVTGQIPIDPALAALSDSGTIEYYEGKELDQLFAAIETLDENEK